MKQCVIVDTGPLVAFLHRREAHHGWAGEQFRRFGAPLITCEPVLTEAGFVHCRLGGEVAEVTGLVHSGAVEVPFRLESEAEAVSLLLRRYKSVPMSLADACLVRMAELHPGSSVLTLDSHFRIYRMHDRRMIPTIMPGR